MILLIIVSFLSLLTGGGGVYLFFPRFKTTKDTVLHPTGFKHLHDLCMDHIKEIKKTNNITSIDKSTITIGNTTYRNGDT